MTRDTRHTTDATPIGSTEPNTPAVVLLSGGLDSTTLLHFASRQLGIERLHALSFVYGQKHRRELEMAEWQAGVVGVEEHRTVDLGVLGVLTAGGSALTDADIAVPDLDELEAGDRQQPPTYVPNRNMVLLGLAAAYAESCGATRVLYGAQAQDAYGYWDCTEAFVDKLNAVLALNRKTPVRVDAPFVGMSKVEILRIGFELSVDYGHTWTCYRGGASPCGTCPTCVERASAFEALSMPDPLVAGTGSEETDDE